MMAMTGSQPKSTARRKVAKAVSYLASKKPHYISCITLYVSPSGSNNLHCRLHGQYFFIPRKNTTNSSPSAATFDMARYYKYIFLKHTICLGIVATMRLYCRCIILSDLLSVLKHGFNSFTCSVRGIEFLCSVWV